MTFAPYADLLKVIGKQMDQDLLLTIVTKQKKFVDFYAHHEIVD